MPDLNHLPLSALRVLEAATRLASFSRAAEELHITPAAISQQIRLAEARLGVSLFERQTSGVQPTNAARTFQTVLAEAFASISNGLDEIVQAPQRNSVVIGCVGTFALGWLFPRLRAFKALHPQIDIHVATHNNRRVDHDRDQLDLAVRFGNGRWAGVHAELLMESSLTPICSPRLATGLKRPADLLRSTLLSTYHKEAWSTWFVAAKLNERAQINLTFDSSLAMAQAALDDIGIAIADPRLFSRHIRSGSLVTPFSLTVPARGGYWLTRQATSPAPAIQQFREWLLREAGMLD